MYNKFQMNSISDLIIKEKNNSTVFVFPSEAAAVQRRKDFLTITGKKAVRNDRFISWDSFKEDITLHNREEKPVNSVLRRLFSADIIRKNASGEPFFRRLIPAEYSERAGAFTDTVFRVLPELQKLVKLFDDGCCGIDDELKKDYRRIYHDYTNFLSANGLFEPSWELPDLKLLKKLYYIICPELIEDFSEYEALLTEAGCRFYRGELSGSPGELKIFENSVVEADAVLNQISALLDDGVHYSDIAVTCADREGARLLLSAASLRGLPLNHRSGKTLAEYPAGRLPELLRACRSSGYSISSMKNLLLYRAFVWKEAETAAALIRFGIENRCLKNTSARKSGDVWASRLEAAGRKRLLGFYSKLKIRIEALCACGSFVQLSKELQIFISTFLETNGELWDESCEQVFQRTREVLTSLRDTEEILQSLSVDDPLGIWIELLNEKIYVPRQESGGVPVYSYRVSALINPGIHFITGLSHDASAVVSAAFGFLTDQQRRDAGAAEQNMTDDFLKLYGVSGRDVRFSCAEDTPTGTALPPAVFIKHEAIHKVYYSTGSADPLFNSPVISENIWWQNACGTNAAGSAGAVLGRSPGRLPRLAPAQKKGFGYAAVTFMNAREFDASIQQFPPEFVGETLAGAMNDREGSFRVSASALNRWTECPFSQLFTGPLEVKEDEYLLQPEDPMSAGNIMHEILCEFFSRLKDGKQSFRAAGHLEEYRRGIEQAAVRVFNRWEAEENYFFGPAWDSLKRRALEDLLQYPAAEAEFYDGLFPEGLELWLDFILEPEQIHVGGYIDRISTGEAGAVIVDYKKTWKKKNRKQFISLDEDGSLLPPPIGYQLPLYIMLAEANGYRVAGSSYYGISKASHFPVSGESGVLSDDDVGMLCELTLESIRSMADACRAGDFRAPDRCDGCRLRAICRKRFNVRWAD